MFSARKTLIKNRNTVQGAALLNDITLRLKTTSLSVLLKQSITNFATRLIHNLTGYIYENNINIIISCYNNG